MGGRSKHVSWIITDMVMNVASGEEDDPELSTDRTMTVSCLLTSILPSSTSPLRTFYSTYVAWGVFSEPILSWGVLLINYCSNFQERHCDPPTSYQKFHSTHTHTHTHTERERERERDIRTHWSTDAPCANCICYWR